MLNDIEIAQAAELSPISDIAKKLGISSENLEPYGHTKAKISLSYIDSLADLPQGKLILVTAISPTPPGEGKTTTTVGLGDALCRLGKKAVVCLREPSLGPVFGLKGGAAGGGYSQVVPMEDINLHFTGDFNAIQLATNLLAALIDNHIHHGNELNIDQRRVTWRRVLDMNDRSLRSVNVGLGGPGNGFPRQDGFDIVVASEVMAILCLATSRADLKNRLGNIVIGYTRDQKPVRASELKAHGSMAVLLKDALKPNLVQTLEHTPAFIHGGPFANIAHGCNSVMATQTALKLADYVVTEAGFGADLGAEKFINIKCRKSGLRPSAAVIVATVRALKYHGGVDLKELTQENLDAVKKGIVNLERHIENIKTHFGLPCVVAINHFSTDTSAELELIQKLVAPTQTSVVVSKHWAEGGRGAIPLAKEVLQLVENGHARPEFLYLDSDTLWEKINHIAKKIYGASEVTADPSIRTQLEKLQTGGFGNFPVCIAKTQYSFSIDAKKRGAPSDHTLHVREVRLAAGAEFIVVICGDIMTMPGLPRLPAALKIDMDDTGKITGLF
jgi:formate--tetrahydrofolate ligase